MRGNAGSGRGGTVGEQELRELDIQVHKALYPDDQIGEKRDMKRHSTDIWYTRSLKTHNLILPVPHYTTDLAAWDAIRPEWMWELDELRNDKGERYVDTTLNVPGSPYWRDFDAQVYEFEARGLAAYALGRARCVLQWAEAQR